jgi:hypothetical protein
MQNNAIKPTAKTTVEVWLCILAIGFGILVMLLWWHTRTSFWEDEVIAITHANQPLPLFFIETLRNDIHPPLYFLQLKLWHDIGFTSDQTVLLNSVLCALFSLITLFVVARKVYGDRAACFATALFALFPIFAYSGGNLRMYGLVPGCVLLVWYANRTWFVEGARKWLVWAAVFEVIASYLHAIEFFFVGFIALAACLENLFYQTKSPVASRISPRLRAWVVTQVIVLLLIAPLMASGMIRGSEASAPASLFELLTEPGALIAGWAPASILPMRLAGLVIFVFLAAAATLERRSRTRTVVAVILTLAVAIAVSMLAKPMIKVPVFAASLLPLLALGAGAGIASAGRYWRVGAFACMAAMAAAAVPLMNFQMTNDAYGEAGRLVRQMAKPGDVVVVPNVSVYWGVMRYAVGERWGKPLEIMPMEANDQWKKIFNKLGPKPTAMLGLHPVSDHVTSNGVTYAIGEDAKRLTANAQRVLVVQRNNFRVDVQLGARFVRESITRPKSTKALGPDDLAVSLFIKNENGDSVARHPLNLIAP